MAAWKGGIPPSHLPPPGGMLVWDAVSHQPPERRECRSVLHCRGEDLPPSDTLQPVSTDGRALRSGGQGEGVKWRQADRKA